MWVFFMKLFLAFNTVEYGNIFWTGFSSSRRSRLSCSKNSTSPVSFSFIRSRNRVSSVCMTFKIVRLYYFKELLFRLDQLLCFRLDQYLAKIVHEQVDILSNQLDMWFH